MSGPSARSISGITTDAGGVANLAYAATGVADAWSPAPTRPDRRARISSQPHARSCHSYRPCRISHRLGAVVKQRLSAFPQRYPGIALRPFAS